MSTSIECVLLVLMILLAGKASAAEPGTGPSDGDSAEFARIYFLQGEDVLRRVPPPFAPSRLTFYRARNPGQAKAIPRGPDAMMVQIRDGKPMIWGMRFGGSETLTGLLESLMKIYPQEIEGDDSLFEMKMPGDFVFKAGASPDAYRTALERVLRDEMETPVTLTFRDVERPVILLKGNWAYKPLDATASQRKQIEIYGADLNRDRNTGGGGSGNAPDFAGWLGRFIKRSVVVEADGIPKKLSWHYNDSGDGTPQSRDRATDPTLVLNHVQEQTGLSWSEETRKVRRLFVERAEN